MATAAGPEGTLAIAARTDTATLTSISQAPQLPAQTPVGINRTCAPPLPAKSRPLGSRLVRPSGPGAPDQGRGHGIRGDRAAGSFWVADRFGALGKASALQVSRGPRRHQREPIETGPRA